jgi:TRAP-type C4-dicarboxylate transport system permease small subunit
MNAMIRVYDAVVDGLAAIAGLLLVLCIVGIVLDVTGRYFWNTPLPWVFELTEYALLYIPCLGMAWLARDGGHVAVDIVTANLRPSTRLLLGALVSLVTAVVCALIAYWGLMTTWDSFERGITIDKYLRIPRWAILGVIPLGFALTAVEFARIARSNLARWRGSAAEHSDRA